MPIKEENLARYPKNWPQIVARIRQRAGNKCEQCGVANGALGGRTRTGEFMRAHAMEERMLKLVWPKPGDYWWCGPTKNRQWLRIIRIVCTTMHLDHTPENVSDANLKYACQKCHLAYDAEHHAQTAYMTRREGRAVADMFGEQLQQREEQETT